MSGYDEIRCEMPMSASDLGPDTVVHTRAFIAVSANAGLTMAETRVALQLARGEPPGDVARNSHVSPTTVRSQLAALFAKTNAKRQAELVKLLARIAILP
ncbi:helix-turn-helix transcriptional regulator [Bosea sp. 2RAB26]|uniref:helix-turn-helix transcriptional regulator n=1 Tax=Bosea sp. 2RAB26 TaxID=3237476 RepID=UPI003F93400F